MDLIEKSREADQQLRVMPSTVLMNLLERACPAAATLLGQRLTPSPVLVY